MGLWLSAIMSAALVAQPAPATANPGGDSTTVESVEIVAKRAQETREAVTAFVTSIAGQTGNKRLGRWDRKICPGVVGLRQDYAQLMIDRIAAAALKVGLEVGESGCKANMIVVATPDSDTLVKSLVAENADAFAKYDGNLSAGRRQLDAFVASEAPVRWWHVTRRVTADGQRYDVGDHVRVREVGRIKQNTRDDFDHVIVVVDTKRTGVVRFGALADYVAMAGLAQIDPDADIAGAASILNLFADRDAGATPAAGLTEWDVAYLQGLYDARRYVRRAAAQEQDVVRSMTRDLTAPPAEPKEEE